MNWFDGITPSLGPFGRILQQPLQMILALVWALAFLYSAIHLVTGIARLAAAKKAHRPVDSEDAAGGVVVPLVATIGLALVPVIFATVVTLA